MGVRWALWLRMRWRGEWVRNMISMEDIMGDIMGVIMAVIMGVIMGVVMEAAEDC